MLLNIPKWPPVKPNITGTYFKMPRNKILLPIKQKRNQTRPDHCIYHRSTWYRLCKRRIQKQLGLVFDFSMTGLNCFGLCEILSKDENPVFHKISQFLDYMYFVSTLIFDIHLNIHLVTIMPFSLLFFFFVVDKNLLIRIAFVRSVDGITKIIIGAGLFFVHCIIILNTGIYRWLWMDFYM